MSRSKSEGECARERIEIQSQNVVFEGIVVLYLDLNVFKNMESLAFTALRKLT